MVPGLDPLHEISFELVSPFIKSCKAEFIWLVPLISSTFLELYLDARARRRLCCLHLFLGMSVAAQLVQKEAFDTV